MPSENAPHLHLASSVKEPNAPVLERTVGIEELITAYECGVEAKPEWCVWVNTGLGMASVLYWIRPCQEAELVARRIAKHLKENGSLVGVDMTEWNPHLEGKPIYARGVSDDSHGV